MPDTELEKSLDFLMEIDRMKTILRRSVIADGSKRENDAEHSWHIAMYALALRRYAPEAVDIDKAVRMCLVHDLVEIYAGDTFCFDAEGYLDKSERETAAADRLFSDLGETGAEFRRLWEEFEAMETEDALYAAAMDRLQPFMLNIVTGGHTWRLAGATKEQVYKRLEPVKKILPQLYGFVEKLVEQSIEKEHIRG